MGRDDDLAVDGGVWVDRVWAVVAGGASVMMGASSGDWLRDGLTAFFVAVVATAACAVIGLVVASAVEQWRNRR